MYVILRWEDEHRGTYSSHGRSEAVGQFAQGTEILLKSLELWWRGLLDSWGAAADHWPRPCRTGPLLLQLPNVGPHQEQQITQLQLDDLQLEGHYDTSLRFKDTFCGVFWGGLFWVSGWRIFHCTLCGVLLLVDAALCCIAGTLHFADKHMQCNYNALQPCPKTCTQCELQLYCYCIEYCVFLFEMQCHCCCSDFSQRNNKKTKHGLTVQKKCLFPTMDDCACVCVCVPCLSWNCGCVVPG